MVSTSFRLSSTSAVFSLLLSTVTSRPVAGESIYDWELIIPSTTLDWTPCFDNFTCTRLQVPLDYGDVTRGKTSIAFIKLSTSNVTDDTQNVVINPGGPGGSGVDAVLSLGRELSQVVGPEHNVIGFDPRGVGNSGPVVDCWPDHPERRAQFERLLYPEVAHASSTALQNQFYAAEIFGQACTPTVGGSQGNAAFISTPAVAEDLLTYIKAEQVAAGKPTEHAKLSYYGVSYGTVLGMTFAHRFPDHIGRMILDGVLDASEYYDLRWRKNLFDTDEALGSFFQYCLTAGPQKCSFWQPSAERISRRFDSILERLKSHPIPVPTSEACDLPLLATYSDLKQYTLEALYSPLSGFPILAHVLSGLERGNTSAYMAAVTGGSIPANPCNNGTSGSTVDANTLIKCVDGVSGVKMANLHQYQEYLATLTKQSRFFGEVWPTNALTVTCRSFHVDPPRRGRLQGSIMDHRKTSFPIMFVTPELDPVTPRRNAHKMASVFQGSVVLTQASVGHSAQASASSCLVEKVQAYLRGQLPPANTTCQPDIVPFQ